MLSRDRVSFSFLIAFLFSPGHLHCQDRLIPEVDRRAVEIRHLNMPYTFQPYRTKEEWLARAKYLRQQILVSSGLWPIPERTPLQPQILGKIERDDYSIEKVYFESYPGFYVTGNLYRPMGKAGPFPAILSPHGHWPYGRLENSALGSIPARCINFARQGYVVFTYDMIGYNDSRQVDHRLIGKPLSLWGIGSLGLHLWNSIRAADFLESLPDVDRNRLACTGASGGGTQTFLLTAVDDRIKASAPVNMISHYMQGGDVCENTANLRLDTNNMEIGALMAPRPLLLVSAAGDWTNDTPRVEFPAIQSVYKLLGAEDSLQTVQVFAEHNYNKESREAVYSWFDRWILGHKDAAPVKETAFRVEFPSNLLVFFGRELPREAKTESQLIDFLVRSYQEQLNKLKPRDSKTLDHFRELMPPALEHSLAAQFPDPREIIEVAQSFRKGGADQELLIGRYNKGDRVPALLWTPKQKGKSLTATLLVHPEGKMAFQNDMSSIVSSLLKQGHLVLAIDCFNTGTAKANRDMSDRFFTTYNRTDDANRVQDILTALAYLKKRPEVARINLAGLERAGLWCLLARGLAPELHRTAADVAQFKSSSDQAYLEELYIPLIRRAGDFKTALTIASASGLLIHNTGDQFETGWLREAYQISKSDSLLRIETSKLSQAEIVVWLK
ncbi:MAG: acetylxylan esterase [Acidobacteria bacterium]|nr:acetylxylan esterase [Acidobacteriota bacterium]MCI0718066.1 acetylxylan esterase [Acidobacteriota bacterium]